jgi:hypothetical protein
MTIFGSIGGTTDPAGSYASEVMAQFGYVTGGASFVPVDDFGLTLSGPPDNPLRILDPVTINGTATLDAGGVYVFEAFAHARSVANDEVPEPLTFSVFGIGIAGARVSRRMLRR